MNPPNDSLKKFDFVNYDIGYKITVIKAKKILKKYLSSIKEFEKRDYRNDHICLEKILFDGVPAYKIDYQLTDHMSTICIIKATNGKILFHKYFFNTK